MRAAAEAASFCVGVGPTRSEAAFREVGASFIVPDLRSVSVRKVSRERYNGITAHLKMGTGSRTIALPLRAMRRKPAK